MLVRSPRLFVRMALDPVAVGAKQLVVAGNASQRRILQVRANAIQVGKTYTMAGS